MRTQQKRILNPARLGRKPDYELLYDEMEKSAAAGGGGAWPDRRSVRSGDGPARDRANAADNARADDRPGADNNAARACANNSGADSARCRRCGPCGRSGS